MAERRDYMTWRDETSETLGKLSAQMDSVVESHKLMREALFGNGQPGIIQELRTKVAAMEKERYGENQVDEFLKRMKRSTTHIRLALLGFIITSIGLIVDVALRIRGK